MFILTTIHSSAAIAGYGQAIDDGNISYGCVIGHNQVRVNNMIEQLT